MSLALVRLPPAEWPALAAFIHAANRRADGGVHCLHAAHGDDVDSHAQELAALQPDAAAFWAVRQDDRLVGVVGCAFDAALARAWLRGPLAPDARVLEALVPLVGPALESALPVVEQFNGFPAADAAALNAWYAAAGYESLQLHTVLRAAIGPHGDMPSGVRRATAADLAGASALHAALFPSPYLGEADFLRALDGGDRALFVAGDDGAVAGYLHVQDNPSDQEAYVDYLGVAPAQRGRGLGRALLDAAARWGAGQGRGHLALTVREDRRSALGLYRRAGFVELSAGRHWRKSVAGAARDA